MIYESADFFLTRFALLPYKELDHGPKTLFDFYKNCPPFQEAVAVASPSLHRSLVDAIEKGIQDDKVYRSLLKYYLRMSSRATPFGLFSAIGWGEFAHKAATHFAFSSMKKKASPDAEWIHHFINTIQKQVELVLPLEVMVNFHLIKKSGRVFLTSRNEHEQISIKSTVVSDFIFYHSKKPIPYANLEQKLILAFDEHPKERVKAYLWDLFQRGYLVSELSGCLNKASPHQHLYQILKKIGYSNELNTLLTSMDQYEKGKFGESLSQLDETMQQLDSFIKIKNPIQVNSYRPHESFHLPIEIKQRVDETVSLLYLLSHDATYPLQTYLHQFQEKYGNHRLVPLLELVDSHLGIGFLLPEAPKIKNERPAFWKELVLAQQKSKTLEIESFPRHFLSQEQLKKAPLSFELFFEIQTDSEVDLNNGNYTLLVNPIGGSLQAGGTFGRFLSLFSSSQQDQLRGLLQQEEALLPHAQVVEASFLPDSPRSANIICHETTRQFQLQMHFHHDASSLLELEDIYVGSTLDRLYLFSKKLGKELQIMLSSVINPQLAPEILQLLLQISKGRFSSFSPFPWKGAESELFLPRLVYKNVILSPARWYFHMPQLNLSEKDKYVDCEKALLHQLTAFEVPDHVYLTEFDHRLIVNWKNPSHFQLLMDHFIKKKELLLYEVIASKNQCPVASHLGHHIAEFVVPCLKNKAYKNDERSDYYPSTQQIRPLDRLQLPGSNWFYIKLFVSSDSEENFLKNQLHPFIRWNVENGWIDKWFYIRYKEEKSHIRLRFHGNPETLIQKLLPALFSHSCRWIASGLLEQFTIHPYEKEIERYGGPECLAKVEEIFCADSHCCLNILDKASGLELPLVFVGALGIINLLQSFYPSQGEQIHFFSHYQLNKSQLAGIREHSAKALKMVYALLYEPEALNSSLKESFSQTRHAAEALTPLLHQNDWNTKESVIQSILHMHCNRLFGPQLEAERKALVIAHHLLEKIIHKVTKEAVCKP